MAASGVQDLGAASDIESYLLRVTGEGGAEIRRVLFFRYRHSAFDLIPARISHAGHERRRYIGALSNSRDVQRRREKLIPARALVPAALAGVPFMSRNSPKMLSRSPSLLAAATVALLPGLPWPATIRPRSH
jgi:hypothetical protein